MRWVVKGRGKGSLFFKPEIHILIIQVDELLLVLLLMKQHLRHLIQIQQRNSLCLYCMWWWMLLLLVKGIHIVVA